VHCAHYTEQGELDVARIRLTALENERRNEHQGSAAMIAELEAKVKDGEMQRRKMHNLIQEVRYQYYNYCLLLMLMLQLLPTTYRASGTCTRVTMVVR
jgi:hypothetical protein